MTCIRTLVLGLAIALGTTSGRAQTPSTHTVRDTVIPATPAGNALRAWLDAFNSGDSTRMTAYTRTWEPSLAAGGAFVFRQQPGRRFDLLSIERSEPRHIEFVLRESRSPMISYGAIDVSAGERVSVVSRKLEPLGPDASIDELRISASDRARVIDRAPVLLDSFYVFPEVAKRVG
ncbi:MAG: hypothetical protein LH467_11985, partial [Gemmatimonadaceae bacterium]|nr:hypothetical protein [Gemmatimonadaceae bacterium]